MFGVVNRLEFTDPVGADLTALMQGALERLRAEPGFVQGHVVRTGERELHLVLLFEDPAEAARITEEVGSPWMREHVVTLLAGPTDRRTGEVVASTLPSTPPL